MKEYGPTKHYGQHNITHSRLILLMIENEKQRGTTKAVEYDKLSPEIRSELIQMIDGPECQSVRDAWTVLNKKIFQEQPKYTALDYLNRFGFIKDYDIQDITVFITPNNTIPLTELIQQCRDYENKRFNMAETSPFLDTPSKVSNNSYPEMSESITPVTPVAQVSEKSDSTNEMLASVLMKMMDRLEDVGNKLDKLTEEKKPAKKVKTNDAE